MQPLWLYVLLFVYLSMAIRMLIFHWFHDFDGWFGRKNERRAQIISIGDLTPEESQTYLRRAGRAANAIALLAACFWPAFFIAMPMVFIKTYFLASRMAHVQMMIFLGQLSAKMLK